MADQLEMTALLGGSITRDAGIPTSGSRCIPHVITRGPRGHHHIETWPGQTQAGVSGTGYLRTFDAGDWVAAAIYVSQVRRGRIEAPPPAEEGAG